MCVSKIKLLPESVANQIAAGEVVTEPASVIKEMVENAVDAHATQIKINFCDSGCESIRIVDNGEGMSPVDARLAFDKHATSKIRAVDDIYSLHTFGFRGEALASIAAVARVELLTRREEDELGTRIVIEGGNFVSQQSVVCPKGSQFVVRNIFYNLPARRRMMESRSVNRRHLVAEFQKVALCHPEIEFMLFDDQSPVYNLPATNLKQRIASLMGRSVGANLLEVQTTTSIVGVEGYTARPESARRNGSEQFLFVNGRYFRSSYFNKAVQQAYDKLIAPNTRPSFFLYLTVEAADVDVNIHPQKTEVRFTDSPSIWQIVNASVRESLAKSGSVPMMEFDNGGIEIPVLDTKSSAEREWHIPQSAFNPDYNPFATDSVAGRSSGAGTVLSDVNEPYTGLRSAFDLDPTPFDRSEIEYIDGEQTTQSSLSIDFADRGFEGALPLAGGYVATSLGGRLAIVDLTRARELILLRTFAAQIESGSVSRQTLLFARRMVLSHDDAQILIDNRDDFVAAGFDYRIVDDFTVEISATPADIDPADLDDMLFDLIDGVRSRTTDPVEVRRRYMAVVLARSGGRVTLAREQIESLLVALDSCREGSFTADGKRVVRFVERDELKKMLD